MHSFTAIKEQTLSVYQKHAQTWDAQRPRLLFEKHWLDSFSAGLPKNASVLDVGCGTGDPIDKYLMQKKLSVTGVDACSNMLNIARKRFPQAQWLEMDMRELSFDGQFDGIISWDGFFHLSQAEQRQALNTFSVLLKPNAALLLTIGDREGEVTGTVAGETVYHASLSPDEYRSILEGLGFNSIVIKLNDETCDFHSLLLATRRS